MQKYRRLKKIKTDTMTTFKQNQNYSQFRKSRKNQEKNSEIQSVKIFDLDLNDYLQLLPIILCIQQYSNYNKLVMDLEQKSTTNSDKDQSTNADLIAKEKQQVPVSQAKEGFKQEKRQQEPIDVIKQLVDNKNPLPLLAIIDQVDIYTKTQQGVPLFNLLMNKFLPLQDLLGQGPIKFQSDADGKTPLHYAVQADDVKAVYWLLSKGAHNVVDKFGNTPVMDSVRFQHRRCFLLLLHYQHINQTLPHVAAQYNRVWELKAMQALGLNLSGVNQKSRTPLQIAIQNYSYEAAEYLASVTENYNVRKLRYFTDSNVLMKRVIKGKLKHKVQNRAIIPLAKKATTFVVLLLVTILNQFYTHSQSKLLINLGIYAILFTLIFVMGFIFKPKKKQAQSILHLLRQPDFPSNLDHICPSCCSKFNPLKQDHCDICHTCVPKFHQHSYVCINKANQIMWYGCQYFYLYLLFTFLKIGIHQCIQTVSGKFPHQSFLTDFIYTIYYNAYLTTNYISALFFLYLFGLTVGQFLFCLQLFGMAFMNRTYQQVNRTQDYPHLYSVFKNKAGKMKTKQIRIFLRYKLLGGLCVGIRNILVYFW